MNLENPSYLSHVEDRWVPSRSRNQELRFLIAVCKGMCVLAGSRSQEKHRDAAQQGENHTIWELREQRDLHLVHVLWSCPQVEFQSVYISQKMVDVWWCLMRIPPLNGCFVFASHAISYTSFDCSWPMKVSWNGGIPPVIIHFRLGFSYI